MAHLLEAIRSERATYRKPTRSAALALTFVSPPGTAQFYLGQRRRAWLWAVAVPFGYATYVLLLVGVPLPWAYGSFVYFAVSFLLGWRVAALVDLFLVPSERFQRPGALKVCAFYAASLALSVGVLVLTRSYVAEAFKIPSLVKQGHPWLNGHEVPHCKVATARPPGAEASGDLEIEFLDGRAYLTYFEVERDAPAEEGPWLVPPSRAFVLGDNRHNSLDSRRFFEGRGGGVPFADLKGAARFIWLAFGAAGDVAWERMGMPVDEIH